MASSSSSSGSAAIPSVVSTSWLQSRIQSDAANTRIFDASYFLADKTRDAQAEYQAEHIANAQYFDITRIADTSSPWPNTVPGANDFEVAVRALGVDNQHTIVAYDRLGLNSAARVWWLFRYFGHHSVAVLDGGMPKWLADGLPVDSESVQFPGGDFVAKPQADMLISADQVLDIVSESNPTAQIVDARAAGRFRGDAPEPRAGLRAGHIPGSVNLPFNKLLNEDHTFKTPDELAAEFADAGVDRNRPIVTSCGSGVTACVLALGLEQLGCRDVTLFDGSWTEWGSRDELPIVATSKS